MAKAPNVCLILLASFASVACSVRDTDERSKQIVGALEQKWLQAQRDNATAPLKSLLAESFVDTGSDGVVRNKAEAIAGQNTVRFSSADYDDMKITVYGDTAVVTTIMNAKAVDASGKPLEIHERNTDTWVHMPNSQWQCVATQQTTVPPAFAMPEKRAGTKTMSTRTKE